MKLREIPPLNFLYFSPFPLFPLIFSQFMTFLASVAKILTYNGYTHYEEIILDQNSTRGSLKALQLVSDKNVVESQIPSSYESSKFS